MRKSKIKLTLGLCLVCLMFLTQSCGTVFGPQGGLFTSQTVGVYGTESNASKTGEACVQSILGLVAFGDGSVQNAAMNGGISVVKSIDLNSFSVLMLYARLCTVVKGE